MTPLGGTLGVVAVGIALACAPVSPRRSGATTLPLTPSATPVQASSHAGPLAELGAELAAIRGVGLAQPPELVELSRAELLRGASDQVRRTTPVLSAATAVRTLSSLELAPPDLDYFAAAERMLEQNLQAYYDPDQRVIFVDRALVSEDRHRAILHELVHATQFVARPSHDPSLTFDQRAALHTLAEGEAVYVTERLSPVTPRPIAALDADVAWGGGETPAILLRSLAASYDDGRDVVVREYRAGGWARIDELWTRLPLDTHRLLHPEDLREPVHVPVPQPPEQGGWRLRSSDVLGEQALRCVLQEWWAEPEARRIASAWIGDRLAWFESGQRQALIWALQFDGAFRAAEAVAAFGSGLRLDGAGLRPIQGDRASAPRCRAHRDSGVLGVLGQSEQVWLLVLHGLSTEAGCRTLAAWSSRLVSERGRRSTRVSNNSPVNLDP